MERDLVWTVLSREPDEVIAAAVDGGIGLVVRWRLYDEDQVPGGIWLPVGYGTTEDELSTTEIVCDDIPVNPPGEVL